MKIALFPGSFDPITMGHIDIIERATKVFDKVVVGIGVNSGKTPMFSIDQRTLWIHQIFKNTNKVEVIHYTGLTIDACAKIGAKFILRGIRYASDFEYEKGIADLNRTMNEELDTVFLTSSPEYSTISSTLVRDVIRNHGNASKFIPDVVMKTITDSNN